jgi:hypothetical protein
LLVDGVSPAVVEAVVVELDVGAIVGEDKEEELEVVDNTG